MGDKTVIALVIGAVVIVVVILLRGRLKSLGLKLFGHEVSASMHKPAGPPPAGAHMTDVKARGGATVRDETGQVATMTKVETEGDATVTASGPPRAPNPSKKRPAPWAVNASGGSPTQSEVQAGRDVIQVSAETVRLTTGGDLPEVHQALYQLPAPVGDFTGRTEELNELLDHAQRGGVAICGMQGMGGIGKTELAYKLAERLAPQYPTAQILYDLRGTDPHPHSPDDAMRHVLLSFDRLAPLPDDFDALRAAYLSRLHGARVLLLMDNAADDRQVEPLRPPPGCLLIVTSRRALALPGMFTRNIDPMRPEKSRELLLRICERIAGDADALAALCDHLPLALTVAASTLKKRRDLGVDDFLSRLSDEKQRLDQLDGVEASIALSDALLADDLQARFHALAVFAGSFDRAAAAVVWELDDSSAGAALGDLTERSLLQWDQTAQRYRLHDLVRLFAERRLSPGAEPARTARLRHAVHYRGILAAADDLYRKHGESTFAGLTLFDRERLNIEAGFRWAREHSGADDEMARLCSAYPDAGVYCLVLRQHPAERLVWLQAALAAAERLGDRPDAAAHAGNLGLIHRARGDLDEAERMHRKALEIEEKLGDLKGMAANYGNLGLIHQTRGDLDEAERMQRKALEIEEKLGRLEGMASQYGNLGLIHETRGDLHEAERMLRKSLEIEEKLGRLEGMAANYGDLGLIHHTRGDLDEAERMLRKSLEINEKLGRLEGMANQYGNLGLIHQTRGDLDEAERMHRKSLEIEEQLGRLEGMANQYGNLGLIHETRGDLDEAERMLSKALEIEEKLGRLEGMANAYGNLGLIHQTRGDLDEAERNLRKSLEIDEKLGRLEGMANQCANLASVREQRGDLAGARDLWTRSRDLYTRIGMPHRVTELQGVLDGLPPSEAGEAAADAGG